MKILFIGNSATYYNDMPELLGKLMRENGIETEIFSVTKGGRKLAQNFDDRDETTQLLEKLLAEECFDTVFLQEHSRPPLFDFDAFRYAVAGLVKKLEGKSKRIILYATCTRRKDSPDLLRFGLTVEEMSAAVVGAYRRLGAELGLEVSYAGLSFASLYPSREDIDLFAPDGGHHSYVGSCLVAITHYKTLFGKLPQTAQALGLEDNVLSALLEAAN